MPLCPSNPWMASCSPAACTLACHRWTVSEYVTAGRLRSGEVPSPALSGADVEALACEIHPVEPPRRRGLVQDHGQDCDHASGR
jgi:hypothetical protein